MKWTTGIGLSPIIGSKSGTSWSTYWTSLISAIVENAAPTNIVLTFPISNSLVASDFTVKVNGVNRVGNSASWTGAVITLVLASAVSYADVVIVTFVKSGGTANVTNNVAATTELTTYITGLVTPLSLEQRRNLNEFIKSLNAGFGSAVLSDVFDALYILAGETSESSLKNLAKNAHHATPQGSPAFTQFEGFKSIGAASYINSNYNPIAHSAKFNPIHCSMGLYSRTNLSEDNCDVGFSTGSSPYYQNCIYPRFSTGNFLGRLNNTAACNTINAVSDSMGMFIVSRSGNTMANLTSYKNKNTLSSVAGTFTTGVNYNLPIYILGLNWNNTAVYVANKQLSLVYFGWEFSEAWRDVLVDAFETYMDSNGKGVIP